MIDLMVLSLHAEAALPETEDAVVAEHHDDGRVEATPGRRGTGRRPLIRRGACTGMRTNGVVEA
jgi:hypothetical protein